MKLILDTADTAAIRKLCEYLPVDGVTTNPSILARSGREPYEVLKEIRSIIGEKDLHVQVISRTAEGMIEEAETIVSELGKNTFIKIPVTLEGVKAIRLLTERGFLCTGTAVYTVEQAYLAAHAGAKWLAPYVNRIENICKDGVGTVRKMQEMLRNNGYETKIVGASFHRADQITGLAECGVAAATVGADLLMHLLDNEHVEGAVDKFTADFEGLYGKGRTMAL